MLRIEQELPGLPQFNLPFAYRLRGRLNVPALERSLTEVVRRHESLRAGFVWQDERPVALITPAAEIRSSLIVEDLAAPGVAADTQTQALMLRKVKLKAAQECLKPIDMKQPPLFRARLWRLGAEDHVLLLVFHDLIIDGWSVVVFIEELSEIYADFAAARRAQLPQPALRYSDFARWQRQWSTSRSATTQLMYWNERLRKVSPVFAGKPDVKGELTARTAEKHFKLSTDLIAHLTTLSRSQGATLFMTLLAGFNTLVMLRTGRNNICVATMMANRARTGTDRVIGPFANTSLIRTQIDADQSFEEVLNRVRNAVLEAYTMQELPFDILAERLGQEGLDPGSLIQFYFVLQVPFRRPIKLDNVTVRPFGDRRGQSMAMPIDRIWLSVTVGETPWGMTGTCRYKKKLFEEDPVQNWVREYKLILAKAAANPKKLLGRLADVNPIGIEEQFAARLDPGRKAAKCPC